MSYATLQIGAIERTLEDWGISDPQVHSVSFGVGTFTATVEVQSVAVGLFTAFAEATLRLEREQSDDGFTGGTIRFYGCVLTVVSEAGPDQRFILTCVDPVYWLTIPYQQDWVSGSSTNVWLMANPDFGKTGVTMSLITAGQQIKEIIDFARAKGVKLQHGSLWSMPPQPGIEMPLQQERDLRCIDAIRACCRFAPDMVSWVDYSTVAEDGSPLPTIYFARASQLPVKDVTLDGETVEATGIKAKTEWYRSAVQLNFERIDTVDDTQRRVLGVQVYPPAAWDGTKLRAEYALQAHIQTFDLEGSSVATVSQDIVTVPIHANAADDAVRIGWWREKCAGLRADSIVSLAVEFVGAFDDNGVQLSTWPDYELVEGSIAAWMADQGVAWATSVTFWCRVRYQTASGQIVEEPRSFKIKTCVNVNTAGLPRTMRTAKSVTYAEPEPAGLAQYLWVALSRMYYDGSVSLDTTHEVGIGCSLNLIGGDPAWATMQTPVQEAVESIEDGTVVCTLGVAPHLRAEDLLTMLRWNRQRRVWLNPACRNDSSIGSGGSTNVEQGRQTPNTYESQGDMLHSVFVAQTEDGKPIKLDSRSPNGAKCELKLSDAEGKEIKLRRYSYCQGGVTKTVILLGSEVF